MTETTPNPTAEQIAIAVSALRALGLLTEGAPTEEQIERALNAWDREYNHGKAKFDRWLAEVERAAAEKAWDRAEGAFEEAHNADMLEPWPHLRENPYRAAEIREGK